MSLRRGTTVAELTIVILLLGLMVGGVLSVIDRQRRFYRGTSSAAGARSQMRQAAAVLPPELRGLSPAGGDIVEALDSAIEFHATIGSGVVCERGDDWIALAPIRPEGAPILRGELAATEPGDRVHIFVPDDVDPGQDRWPSFRVAEAVGDLAACAAGPFTEPTTDAGKPRLRLTLTSLPPARIEPGSPVRITRLVRYSLYRSGDRRWYLGVRDQRGGQWSGIQPVSGPYAAYGRERGGIEFGYQDAAGVPLATDGIARAARITLALRSVAGDPLQPPDSAGLDVAIRNRSR